MNYVLFRENPNTHREVYLKRIKPGEYPEESERLGDAKQFKSAAAAYAYGEKYALEWWRVGQR